MFVFLPTLTERAFSYPSVRKNEKTEDLSYALKVFSLGSVSQPLCQLINKSINTSVRNHTIDRLEERGVDRASARRSSLKGRERAIKDERGSPRTREGHQGRERVIKDERGPSRTREGHRQSDEQWNHFKGDTGETFLRDRVERIWAFPSA